jgi:hypothetical protein
MMVTTVLGGVGTNCSMYNTVLGGTGTNCSLLYREQLVPAPPKTVLYREQLVPAPPKTVLIGLRPALIVKHCTILQLHIKLMFRNQLILREGFSTYLYNVYVPVYSRLFNYTQQAAGVIQRTIGPRTSQDGVIQRTIGPRTSQDGVIQRTIGPRTSQDGVIR